MEEITGEIRILPDRFAEIKKKAGSIPGLKSEIEKAVGEKITQVIEVLLGGSLNLGASDVHIEPEKEGAKIRLRLDGLLQDAAAINRESYESLVSRVKLLSGLKLNISDRPQDGRFSIVIDESMIEVRASSLPAENGEAIVLRILNPKSLIKMSDLGLRKDLLAALEREIKKPHGMIIVTGPTGSGKTTTLYAFLNEIQKPEIKIITIEDPIEYHLKGISQTQVQPERGYNFATGLKSIVRQDPDVILVGEVRDLETADIALQAALTGHLVLSTLHTNDAAGTIARLTSLSAKVSNIAPAINAIIAQRLVRKICARCGKMEKASVEDFEKIKKGLQKLPKTVKIPKLTASLKIPKTKGCENCNFMGYRGRIGIYELFSVDDDMEKFILTNPSTADLKSEAIKKGMVTMQQDGLIKVLEGLTTLEELERITGE